MVGGSCSAKKRALAKVRASNTSGHDDGGDNIMASALNHVTSVNDANVKSLADARERDWPRRLRRAGALYYTRVQRR